jgi:hypothetical protein
MCCSSKGAAVGVPHQITARTIFHGPEGRYTKMERSDFLSSQPNLNDDGLRQLVVLDLQNQYVESAIILQIRNATSELDISAAGLHIQAALLRNLL